MNEALKKAQESMRKKREAGEEIERLDPVEKSMRNPKSLRLAINGKCWDCSGESRKEIKECHIKKCTLWAVRPYQDK